MVTVKTTGKRSSCTSNSFEKLLQSLPGNNTTSCCSSHFQLTAKCTSRAKQQEEFRIPSQNLTGKLCLGHSQLQFLAASCTSPAEHFLKALQEQKCFGIWSSTGKYQRGSSGSPKHAAGPQQVGWVGPVQTRWLLALPSITLRFFACTDIKEVPVGTLTVTNFSCGFPV